MEMQTEIRLVLRHVEIKSYPQIESSISVIYFPTTPRINN